MPNRAGLAPADKAYLEALRAVTREVGALLIFDEVITFRLGFRGAQGLWGIDPDLTTLGKDHRRRLSGRRRRRQDGIHGGVRSDGQASRRCRMAGRFPPTP